LIPSKYSTGGDSVLSRIADDDAHFRELTELEGATNDRLLAEGGLLPGIGLHDLVFAVPYARVVNAAFCHAHPLGSRFNGPDRGAWYAAFAIETAQAEVTFHRAYDDYLADFSAELHDLRDEPNFASSLAPDSYVASQGLAETLLAAGSLGVVYPSVRHVSGTCLACFRPALVNNVRKGKTWRFTWAGTPEPQIEIEHQ
jgi:hypothetical protein